MRGEGSSWRWDQEAPTTVPTIAVIEPKTEKKRKATAPFGFARDLKTPKKAKKKAIR